MYVWVLGAEDSGVGHCLGLGSLRSSGIGGGRSRMDGGNAMQCDAMRSRGEEEDVRKGNFGNHTVGRAVGWRGKRKVSENG